MMSTNMINLAKTFNDRGWIHLKSFFSQDEIEHIRAGVEKSVSARLEGDLLCNPFLCDLTVLHPKILDVTKEILADSPVYIGDSNISFDDLAMSLHKDNPDKFNGEAPDWRSDYTVLRMGIYLHDFENFSGGLIIRDRSHKEVSRWRGKVVNVKTTPGDLVIWNLRTTHSGNARRWKLFPGLDINPYINKLLPSFLFLPTHNARMALFISYGKDDQHLRRYIEYLKTRTYAVDRWKRMQITDELRAKATRLGVKLIDLSSDAKNIDASKVNIDHKELDF